MMLRILLVHNHYQRAGGEDRVFEAEAELLRSAGHVVLRYTAHNDRIETMGRVAQLAATLWNRSAAADIAELVRSHRVELVHFHNTFPLISPAAFGAARGAGAAVVQTLHNFRLLCASPYLYREGHVCEQCVGRRIGWPGVVHGCYRGSRAASAVVVAATALHRAIGAYHRGVDRFIVPSEFARRKLLEAGLDPGRLIVKPHFVEPDPGEGDGRGGYAVYVGRLSGEKGLGTLLRAWRGMPRECVLKIIGDGPLGAMVREASQGPNVQWLGPLPPERVQEAMGGARFVVVPSECQETFGRVVIEAFAKGTPALVSRLGAQGELVEAGGGGMVFEPGDADDLAAKARAMFAAGGGMRQAARERYLRQYTGRRNYQQLMAVYESAMALARGAPEAELAMEPDLARGA